MVFINLPTELLVEIFQNLEYTTLTTKVRPVCRRFRDLIDDTDSGPLLVNLFRFPKCSDDNADEDGETMILETPTIQWEDVIGGSFADEDSFAALAEGVKLFSFSLHPAFLKLRVNYRELQSASLRLEQDVGFMTWLGDFTPLSETKLRTDRAFSAGVPEEDIDEGKARFPLAMCCEPDVDALQKMTVEEFLKAFTNALGQRWARCRKRSRKGVVLIDEEGTGFKWGRFLDWRNTGCFIYLDEMYERNIMLHIHIVTPDGVKREMSLASDLW